MAYFGKEYDSIPDPVDIAFDRIAAQTESAWLLRFLLKFGDKQEWLPKSQCGMDKEQFELNGMVYIPYWLAEEKGLV